MVSIDTADLYFQTQVLHNDLWVNADEATKGRALKNAENTLYRSYRQYNPTLKPLPDIAVFEQAYFLLLIDETIQRAALGVKQVSVSGISVSVDAQAYPISPETKLIISNDSGGVSMGVRLGRSLL
jgi:hypothetical protein